MVFHCAATIRFNLPLKEAANLNMQGVRRLITLCHRMPLLKVGDGIEVECSAIRVTHTTRPAKRTCEM